MQTGTSAEAARRKSSTTVNLKFMALGKILPIDENKKADGEKKGEGPGDGGAGRSRSMNIYQTPLTRERAQTMTNLVA